MWAPVRSVLQQCVVLRGLDNLPGCHMYPVEKWIVGALQDGLDGCTLPTAGAPAESPHLAVHRDVRGSNIAAQPQPGQVPCLPSSPCDESTLVLCRTTCLFAASGLMVTVNAYAVWSSLYLRQMCTMGADCSFVVLTQPPGPRAAGHYASKPVVDTVVAPAS